MRAMLFAMIGTLAVAGAEELRFAEGFEEREWWKGWGLSGPPARCEVVEADKKFGLSGAKEGKKALRILVEKGKHYGTSLDYMFRKVAGKEPEKAYFRYDLLLGKGWDYGGKMPGFGGTYNRAGWGGRPSDGRNGWSARGSGDSREGGYQMGTYCYHADMTGKYGNVWRWKDVVLETGRWYRIEQFCQLNTPGKKDGIIRAWVDGKLVFEKTDIRMRLVPELKIEKIWFNVYHGGKEPSPVDGAMFIDGVVIGEERGNMAD